MAELETANSESETESTEEEIEPKFKYRRIENDLKEILNKDVVTCSAVHSKFLLFGTFLGRVYILDHQGNSIKSNLEDGQREFAHTVAVNHIDIDAKGEYVATCSDDGKVNITGLFNNENNQNVVFSKSIKAVALDPDPKSTGKRFIVGDDKLTLYEKSFIKKLKSNVLCTAEGYVLSVCWNGFFVAWASYLGVRVYDLNEKCSLGLMKWEEPKNARLENFRCNFRWSNPTTLIIGWVDTIRICVIRKRNSIEASTRDLPGYIVDPISTFQTSFYISGVAPLTINQLVVLGYPKEKDSDRKALRPVLCVVDYKMNSSEETCTDSLSLRGHQEYTVNDYSLGCIIEESRYFIIAPKDVVVASLCDTEYRVNWLVEHRKYEEAMEVISTHGGSVSLISVARLYINDLLQQEKFDEAAKLCLRVLGNDKDLWEEEVYKFVKPQKLRAISAYLPVKDDCKLNPHVYEIVLYEYLQFDTKGFLSLIKEWPAHLYDSSAVIKPIHDHLKDKSPNSDLLESLAILYSRLGNYENALLIYLKLQNKDVFDLIRRYDLYSLIYKINNMIIELVKLDKDGAFKVLLDGQRISPEIVVKQLEQNEQYLYWYLIELDKKDDRGLFHGRLVDLYAKFEPDQLLPFLKLSKHYPMQEALDICKKKFMYPEMVYLLGQMGNTVEALNILLYKIKKFDMAIEFCQEHDDTDLWNILIDESIKDSDALAAVFEGIVGYVNPQVVVNKIKLGQKIPALRAIMTKMLWDYRLQKNILEDISDIQLDYYFSEHAKVVKKQSKGVSIYHDQRCQKCNRTIIFKDNLPGKDVIVFFCGHLYHDSCVSRRFTKEFCYVCKVEESDDDTDDDDDSNDGDDDDASGSYGDDL